MALTRAQVDTIVARLKGSRDLSAGGVSALKDVLYLVADDIQALHAAPYVIYEGDNALTGALVATGAGGVVISPEANPGEVVFSI